MSESKIDYLSTLPLDLKSNLFSFFTAKELITFPPTITKEWQALSTLTKEKKLLEDYEKIQTTKLWIESVIDNRGNFANFFHVINTYTKFKAFIDLNPNYLLTFHEEAPAILEGVGVMMSISGAEFSLHLLFQNKQKIASIYESNYCDEKSNVEEWFANLVTEIKCFALVHGHCFIINTFFPSIVHSKLLEVIVMEMVITGFNDSPLIDSGVDEESDEGVLQVARFSKVQQHISTLLKKHSEDYKSIVQMLLDKGLCLSNEAPKYEWSASQILKMWRKEHDYYLPSFIIELLDLVSNPSRINEVGVEESSQLMLL